MVMPAVVSAASIWPSHPATLIPPSVTAREPSAVGLPGKPIFGVFAAGLPGAPAAGACAGAWAPTEEAIRNAAIAKQELRMIRMIFSFHYSADFLKATGIRPVTTFAS